MRNIAPTRALTRRARGFLQGAFFLVAFGGLFAAAAIFLTAIPLVAPTSSSFGLYNFVKNAMFIFGLIVAAIGVAIAIRAGLWSINTDNDLARIVGNALGAYLDERYTYIRNVSKINVGYIDAVLIGVQGVLVFRILDKTGVYLNEGDRWLRLNPRDRRWVPGGIDPTRQAMADMRNLQSFLSQRGLPADTPIFGVVVFVRDAPLVQITHKSPALPATQLSGLYSTLQGNYLAKERISRGAADAIVRLLYNS
jgi:hypothetical protein